MRYKLSLNDLKNLGVDKEKLATLTLTDKYLYRPIGIRLSLILYNFFGFTPNMISILSGIFASIGFISIMLGGQSNFYMGISFLMLWAILDCSDGSLARTLYYKHDIYSPLGEFYDAFMGYWIVAFLWLTIGYFVYGVTGNDVFLFLGALSSILGLYSRVAYAKLGLVKIKNEIGLQEEDIRKSKLYNFYENLEFGSALFPLLILGAFFEVLPFFIVLYLLINTAMVIWFFNFVYKETRNL